MQQPVAIAHLGEEKCPTTTLSENLMNTSPVNIYQIRLF